MGRVREFPTFGKSPLKTQFGMGCPETTATQFVVRPSLTETLPSIFIFGREFPHHG